MIAADVHGKNHHRDGTIGAHVLGLRLLLADGSVVDCSPAVMPDLFWGCVGGMGLLGVILSARLALMRVPGGMILQRAQKTADLDETLAVSAAAGAAHYAVAWIDCLRGGRGVVFSGEHCAGEAGAAPRPRAVPFDCPGLTLNRFSIGGFNWAYYHAASPGRAAIDYRRFFYPLDALEHWNRLYGAGGLVQFQCVLPEAEGVRALLAEMRRHGIGSFLAVLKLCGAAGAGLLSFPRHGVSLALDFPASPAVFALLARLHAICFEHGGRLYLAKDACAGAESLRHYPGVAAFRALGGG